MLKIISGGQTGIDRLALDIAIEKKIPHGGWCPKGRRAEDGTIPQIYELTETNSKNYSTRTKRNIVESDGTMVLHGGQISGGTELTINVAKKWRKPLLVFAIDQANSPLTKAAELAETWILSNQISKLNIAGPRLSSSPNLPDQFRPFLEIVLSAFQDCN